MYILSSSSSFSRKIFCWVSVYPVSQENEVICWFYNFPYCFWHAKRPLFYHKKSTIIVITQVVFGLHLKHSCLISCILSVKAIFSSSATWQNTYLSPLWPYESGGRGGCFHFPSFFKYEYAVLFLERNTLSFLFYFFLSHPLFVQHGRQYDGDKYSKLELHFFLSLSGLCLFRFCFSLSGEKLNAHIFFCVYKYIKI